MSKTIVNIITEESPIPAYLFVKEKYEPGDRLMFVSAKDDADDMEHLASLFNVDKEQIDEIVFTKNSDEYKYERICQHLLSELSNDIQYCVNLAGGTRYMALAVQQAFEKFHSDFYYVNMEENTLVKSIYDDSIYDNDDYTYPISHRMKVAEYIKIHDMCHDIDEKHTHTPCCNETASNYFFEMYSSQSMTNEDHMVMEKLRCGYRNAKNKKNNIIGTIKRANSISIAEIQNPANPAWIPVSNLSVFLQKMHFEPRNAGYISKDEIDFLTGGWLEEYVYYFVKHNIKPDDIQKGVHISKKNVRTHDNELDVVFTKNNHLYVMECKTGVETTGKFNEIVYKVCALKEALLGLSCHSFIVSFKKDIEGNELKKVAKNMDVTFCDNAILTSPKRMNKLLSNML